MDEDIAKCCICGEKENEEEGIVLKKCIMCFKMYCEECAYFFGGREFCSRQCGDFFFHGMGDENEVKG